MAGGRCSSSILHTRHRRWLGTHWPRLSAPLLGRRRADNRHTDTLLHTGPAIPRHSACLTGVHQTRQARHILSAAPSRGITLLTLRRASLARQYMRLYFGNWVGGYRGEHSKSDTHLPTYQPRQITIYNARIHEMLQDSRILQLSQ